MNYLVHVIDEISNHKKSKDGTFRIIESENDNGEKIHVLRTDAHYIVEAEKSVEAVALLTKEIKIEDENGDQSSLSDILLKTKKTKPKIETKRKIEDEEESDDGQEDINISSSHYSYDHATTSDLMFVSCKIKRKEGKDEWVEYHKVSFYVIEESKIMQI